MDKRLFESKSEADPSSYISTRSRRSQNRRLLVCTAVAAALYLLSGAVRDRFDRADNFVTNSADEALFDWDKIKPTKDLKWLPCYKGF
ncbi:hypothetical protein FRB91_010020, partial [Serendipita sp. 411]